MTTNDFRTPTWSRFTKLLQERLQELRELNDQIGHDPIKTSLTRGQISEVKRLLALSPESARADGLPFLGDADSYESGDN